MDLPGDTYNPASSKQRDIRNTLELVSSYCCRPTAFEEKLKNQYILEFQQRNDYQPIEIYSNGETLVKQLNIIFLSRSHLLLSRFHKLMNNKDTKVPSNVIDISDLNIESNILKIIIHRLTTINKLTLSSIQQEYLLSSFVGCCKLRMFEDIQDLLSQIRNDPGLLDIASLSTSDFKYLLECTSNNRYQVTSALNQIISQANLNGFKLDTNNVNITSKKLGVRPGRRLSAYMQKNMRKRQESEKHLQETTGTKATKESTETKESIL